MVSYHTIRNILFSLDPEKAHKLIQWVLSASQMAPLFLKQLHNKYNITDHRLAQSLLGTTFPKPVGLAAGFDKNAVVAQAMEALGFGFIEVGTVTPKPQVGNPKPRIFRFVEEESLQNAMGFNNAGMEDIANHLKRLYPRPIPIGVNLGKNKTTPQKKALIDYAHLIATLGAVCDYLVVNISSPNIPELRELQNENFIRDLFKMVRTSTEKPVLLKIAPDLDISNALRLCMIACNEGASGIVATNTTTEYTLLRDAKRFGGISGRALREKSFSIFSNIAKELYGQTVLISVGGIDSGTEAYRRIRAGASLVQIYTALVYKGPALVRKINEELLILLEQDGFNNVSEAVGADWNGTRCRSVELR